MDHIVHRIADSEQGNRTQPAETSGKRQREIPAMGPTRPISLLPDYVIRPLKSSQDAIALCMNLSGYTDEQLGQWLGMSKGHICRCRQGKGNFPPNKLDRLYAIAGNAAPIQYGAMRAGWAIEEQTIAAKLAAKEREAAELRAQLNQAA